LKAASTTSTGTTLTWTAPAVPSGCSITSYSVVENGVQIATATGTTFAVTGLSPSTTYSFSVIASDAAGNSPTSTAVSVTTPGSGGGSGSGSSAWSSTAVYTGGMTASAGGVNYKANWWTQGQNPATNSGPAGSGQPWTATGTCASCNAVPGVPSGLTASSTTNTSTVLTWNAASVPANCALSGYTIFKNGAAAGTTAGTSYTATGLSPNTSYSFTVEAADAAGLSSASASASVTTQAGGPPPSASIVFAPYIDMSLTTSEQLVSIQQQSGIKVFTLAFILGNGSCTPSWGGIGSIASDTLPNGTTVSSLIQGVRAAGADVIIAFGGANGTELALGCSSAASLQAAYQSVIDKYGVNMLDFDIEGGATTDTASITRRNQALVGLKAANPGLILSYTLPVLPTGLIDSGVNILNNVKAAGLSVDVINVMAMDYGSAVDNNGQMGLDATYAASNTYKQVQAAGLSATIGVTPMIGVNDTSTEVFQLTDAQMLLNFAKANSYITRLAMWSVSRDNGSCAGASWASPVCSGVAQTPFQYASVFEALQ
jgi:chitinase